MSDSRDMGVEFGDLESDLQDEEYPMTADEVRQKYGDRELEHSSGTTTVEEVLADLDAEYENADGVHQSILNMIGDQAVGEEGYSERGTAVEEGEETDAF